MYKLHPVSEIMINASFNACHIEVSENAEPEFCDFVTLTYVSDGNGRHLIQKKTLKADEGDVFIVNSQTSHCFQKETPYMGVYCIYLSKKMFESFSNEFEILFPDLNAFFMGIQTVLRVRDGLNKELRNIFVRIFYEDTQNLVGNETIIKNYLSILLMKFYRKASNKLVKCDLDNSAIIDQSMVYINMNMSKGIKLNELAQKFFLSSSYFCRLFKKHTGITTTKYINNLKVEKVKDILQNTKRPISRIAETFNCDDKHLRRLFKQTTGMSMYDYRKKYNFSIDEEQI